ncbi:AAA family ATPase [Actinoplanes sp. URMC 104]|uniref:AAA family ATPase n=1 Tax=Actinoplanes sp. URMC 104 TaxID=3423409 RepID=UPI003F1C947E
MKASWPLTGRDEELRAVTAAIRPGAAGIVVAGAAGVGKTRLVREALTVAAGRRTDVVWAHGSTAARAFPLGAFAGLLDVPPGDAAGAIGRALDQLARRRPLVLAVDDAHLLDEHSAIVLHRVVVRGLAPALVTLRTGAPAPDIVTSLWKDDHLSRTDLGPLDLAGTTHLVARVLGGPVESASAHRLWTLTGGSPLFLRHLLTGEVSAGRFTPASGIWRWISEPEISPELTGLVERQIGGLAAGVRDVVDLVALAEPAAVETLAALTSPADLEEAEDRGLVRTDGLVARRAHPLYGEVRRAAMGRLRARRLRGLVARTLDPAADPIPRAVLTLDSDLAPDPALFLRAAEAATRMYDLPLAERLAGAAAATGDPGARLVHASALSWLSRGDEAEAILADLARTAPDARALAMAHLHRTGNLIFTMARPGEARRTLAAAEATGAAPAHVAAMALVLAASTGDLGPVLEHGPALLRAELPDDLARILVASAMSAAAAVTGEPDLLDRAAVVGGLTADRVPVVIPGFGLADFQVLGHRLAGAPDRAGDHAGRMRAASADLPGPARLMGLVIAGHAALAGGRVRDALLPLREAWAGLAGSGHEFRFRCRTLLATALALTGQDGPAAPCWPASSPAAIRRTGSTPPTTCWRGRGARPPGDRRPKRSATRSPRRASPAGSARPRTRCSPGRPWSSSATRPPRCPASRPSPGSAPGPRPPAPMPGPRRTTTARPCCGPPTAGPGSATWSPRATRRPARPTCSAGRGGTVRPCPRRRSRRSWRTGPAPAPRPWRSRPGRCR